MTGSELIKLLADAISLDDNIYIVIGDETYPLEDTITEHEVSYGFVIGEVEI